MYLGMYGFNEDEAGFSPSLDDPLLLKIGQLSVQRCVVGSGGLIFGHGGKKSARSESQSLFNESQNRERERLRVCCQSTDLE